MKKLNKLFFFLLLLLITINVKANSIKSINMDIYVDEMGTAHIKEVWKANLSSGTEGYKPYYNIGESEFKNFTVKDEDNTNYTYDYTWNVNGTFDDKKFHNGINKISNGLELCWGISEYGDKEYTLEYEITNFVINTSDAQMIYWTLIPYELSAKPDKVYIKIYGDKTFSDDLDVWGYGNLGGYAYVYNGYIELSTDDALDSNEYMTVLVKFPVNTFTTTITDNRLFDDFYKMAEEGSTHYVDNGSFWDNIFPIINSVFWAGVFGIIFFVAFKKNVPKKYLYNNEKVAFNKNTPFFREVPCDKNIFLAYFLAKEFGLVKKETDFLGAILLKWIKEKNIEIISEVKGKIIKKEQANIKFLNKPTGMELESEVYNWMVEASGDNVLESKEFEKWCNKHYQKILGWFKDVVNFERNELITSSLLIEKKEKKFLHTKVSYELSDKLYEEATRLAGLKNFLIEFSRIKERQPIEVNLWEYYLMYAQIFGIADKVAEQFKKLYPDVINDFDYNNVVIVRSMAYTGMVSASSAKSRAEAYSSGGGGFSSGGGGGGSFGGGGGGGGFR